MKTICDLLNLITEETKLSEGKVRVYTFEIDTKGKWVSMHVHYEYKTFIDGKWGIESRHEEPLMRMEFINTDSKLQEVYWRIFNLGRSGSEG